jgi:hypothetical protein
VQQCAATKSVYIVPFTVGFYSQAFTIQSGDTSHTPCFYMRNFECRKMYARGNINFQVLLLLISTFALAERRKYSRRYVLSGG